MLVLVFTGSLTLTATLSYVKFEKTLAGVVVSRQQTTLQSLVDTIEAGLNLGLSLGEAQNYDKLVDGAGDKQPDLLGAQVQDGNWHNVYTHSRPGAPVEDLPETPRAETQWTNIGAEKITLGTPLLNSFGHPAGFLVLYFSRQAYDRPLADIGRFMLRSLLVIAAIGNAAAVLMGLLLVQPFNQSLDQIEADLGEADGAQRALVRLREMTAPIEAEIRSIEGSIS